MSFQFNRLFHLAFVYHGTNNGIAIHLNDTSRTSTTIETGDSNTAKTHEEDSTGELIIGKLHADEAGDYSSVMVDELTFWNRQLSETEVEALRNKYEMWTFCPLLITKCKEMVSMKIRFTSFQEFGVQIIF